MAKAKRLITATLVIGMVTMAGAGPAYAGTADPVVDTIAGNGTAASTGDGGRSIAGSLHLPWGMAVAADLTIYVAESDGNKIRKISPDGVISHFAGTGAAGSDGDGGPATAAKLNQPSALALDQDGNLYVAELTGNRIRKVDTSGQITTVAGTGTAGFSGDGGPATAAQIHEPQGLASDGAGALYLADKFNERVRRIDSAGVITTVAGDGTAGFAGDGGPATAAKLSEPRGLAWRDGKLYIADYQNNRVRVIGTDGNINTIAGNGTALLPAGDGQDATGVGVIRPTSVHVAVDGTLYIGPFASRIFKVDTSGKLWTIAGKSPSGFGGDGGKPMDAQLSGYTYALHATAGGNLMLTDGRNHRIRFLDLNPPSAADVAYHGGAVNLLDHATGDGKRIVSITKPGQGEATLHPDSTVTYQPGPGFAGTDTFQYSVTDILANYLPTPESGREEAGGKAPVATGVITVTNLEVLPITQSHGHVPLMMILGLLLLVSGAGTLIGANRWYPRNRF